MMNERTDSLTLIRVLKWAKTILPIILLLFFSSLTIAQKGLTPEQVAKIKTVSSAVISPDGSHIAYTLSVPADPNKENRAPQSHLYVLDVESEESRPYYSTGSVGSIEFRPNHNSITFLTRCDSSIIPVKVMAMQGLLRDTITAFVCFAGSTPI